LSPIPSSYNLTVCPKASTPCSTINFSTSSGSVNLSTQVNAAIIAPRFQAIAGAFGYTDAEAQIQLSPGSTYWNTTNSLQRCYTGSAWGGCAGAASGDVVGPGSSVSTHAASFSGTTGKLLADSGVVATAGNITATPAADATTTSSFNRHDGSNMLSFDTTNNRVYLFTNSGASFLSVQGTGGGVGIYNNNGTSCLSGFFNVACVLSWDGNTSLPTMPNGQLGPATAPSGACTVNGAWVFSGDGHATYCNSGTWATKI
jgi:hypothetical protein